MGISTFPSCCARGWAHFVSTVFFIEPYRQFLVAFCSWARAMRRAEPPMDACERELVPPGSDDSVICRGAYPANTDFKMFVALVSESEPGMGVRLQAERLPGSSPSLTASILAWDRQEGGKVGAAPMVDDGDSFGICVRKEFVSNTPAEPPKGLGAGLLAPYPQADQEAAGDQRNEDEC